MTMISKELILLKNIGLQKHFVWREHWVSPFESMWGIFEKFKFVNCASVQDIFNLFGTDTTRSIKSRIYGSVHRRCTYLSGLDNDLVKSVFLQPLLKINNQNVKKLVELLPYKITHYSYIRDELYFCPMCIKKGFHSLFHQFSLMHECPYHQITLQRGCPNCKVSIPFELSDSHTNEPFRCKCDYSFLDPAIQDLLVPKWEQFSLNQLKSKEILSLLNITSEQTERLKGFHIPLNLNLEEYPDLLKLIMSVITPEYYKGQKTARHNFVKSAPNIRNLISVREIENKKLNTFFREANYFDEIYNSSLKTVKSIASHLKKTILINHKSCIKQSFEWYGGEEDGGALCLLALAYEHWIRFIYGYENNIKVKRFTSYRNYPAKLEFASKQDDPYMTRLYEVLSYYVGDLIEESWAANKWIFNRVLSHLLISNFHNWIEVSQQSILDRTKYKRIPYKLNKFEFPFYILIIPNSKNEPLEFHWWNEPPKKIHEYHNKTP
jgi:TniQ